MSGSAHTGGDVSIAELARDSRRRRLQPLARRALLTETLVGGGLLAVAVGLAALGDTAGLPAGPAVALVLMLAAARTVYIEAGAIYTTPVQLAFVPMLLLLPPAAVPVLVVAGLVLGSLPDVVRGRAHPDRLLNAPGDGWFAIGPTVVLLLFDVGGPDWGDWPIYLLALAAQLGTELVVVPAREWLSEGSPPGVHGRALLAVDGIDLLLSPLGLVAAFASERWDYAFVLLVPPTALLVLYARERSRRLTAAQALADAAREREALIAGASHELVTPTAILVGLTERLVTGAELSPQRRVQLDTVMHRETLALRQLVRQFADYTRLKTDRDVPLELRPVDLRPLLPAIGRAAVPGDLPAVRADADRLHQIVTSLAADATRDTTPQARAAITATHAAGRVTIEVTGPAPPRAEPFAEQGGSAGISLFVTAALVRLHGGTLGLAAAPDGGSRYTLELSAA